MNKEKDFVVIDELIKNAKSAGRAVATFQYASIDDPMALSDYEYGIAKFQHKIDLCANELIKRLKNRQDRIDYLVTENTLLKEQLENKKDLG
jgi:hypothetical protein